MAANDPKATPDSVYNLIRAAILRLDFAPGSELEEGVLSRRFEVSRTPIREALIRLSSEGLVSIQRGRGARVAMLDLSDLRDYFEGLDLLQRAATRLAAVRRTREDLQEIEIHLVAFEKASAAFDSIATNDANHALHTAIGAAAHSGRIFAAYHQILSETQRIAHLCFSESARADDRLETHLEKTMADHRQMYEAIRAGDANAAERVAGAHVELFRRRVVDALMSTRLTEPLSVAV
jgi:DNA-binding GntR family transcriptional regulator